MSEAIRGGSPTKKTAFLILGIMATMAILALSYALWTTKLRRSRDPGPRQIAPRRPSELPGFGYLPKDSDIVIGLHIAEMEQDKKVGQPLLAEPRPAGFDWLLKQVTRTSGMEVKEIDHLLVAISLETQQATVVVKTRRAFLGDRIKASSVKTSLHEGLPLYEFEFQPTGAALVWWVDDKTAIYTIRVTMPTTEHMKGMSKTPQFPDEVLPAPLHQALKERLAKHQFAWAVGRLDRLGAIKNLLPLVPGKVNLGAIAEIKTFAFGLEPIEGLTLTGHLQATDAKSAAKVKGFLDGVNIEGATSKVELPPAEAKEQWVTWQVRGDVAVIREGWSPTKK